MADRPHGRTKYVVEKCRCEVCRKACADYERERKARTAPVYVGADRARQHVRWLSEQGVGLKQIVKVSGVSQGCLWKLMYGDKKRFGRPSKRIRPETERAILAVMPDQGADGARIPAGETLAHVETLVVRGWSKVAIAKHVHGPDARTLQLGHEFVTRRAARIIEGLLDLPVETRMSRHGTPCALPEPVDEVEPVEDDQAVHLDLNPLPEGIDLSWRKQATCRRPEYPTWMFFPARGDSRTIAAAREVCARCPVADQCLDFALATNAEGVWAGTSERQRRALRKAAA